jgi:hypothetical protein
LNNPKTLQIQFSRATKDQEVIQKRYKELWSWHGQQTATIRFHGYQMQGYLKKFVEHVKMFQLSVYPKRYFIIDFTLACILIRKEAFGLLLAQGRDRQEEFAQELAVSILRADTATAFCAMREEQRREGDVDVRLQVRHRLDHDRPVHHETKQQGA